MNIGRHLGVAAYATRRWLLGCRWFPLFPTFGHGSEWPYDVACHLRTRDLRVILDVGANIGQTALYLRGFFPDARIHCFELSARTAEVLRQNTDLYPNISVHAFALGSSSGSARVRLQAHSELNSLRHEISATDTGANGEDVRVCTIDEFVSANGIAMIDILKIDAQAFDLEVLKGAEIALRQHRIKFVYVEVTFDPAEPDCQLFQPLHEHLLRRGLVLSHFYEQWNAGPRQVFCNALYCDMAALEGRPTD